MEQQSHVPHCHLPSWSPHLHTHLTVQAGSSEHCPDSKDSGHHNKPRTYLGVSLLARCPAHVHWGHGYGQVMEYKKCILAQSRFPGPDPNKISHCLFCRSSGGRGDLLAYLQLWRRAIFPMSSPHGQVTITLTLAKIASHLFRSSLPAGSVSSQVFFEIF